MKVGEEHARERILSLRVEKFQSTRVYTCSTRPGQKIWWSDRRLATGGIVDLSCVGTTVDIAECNRSSKSRSDLTITGSINDIIEEEHLSHQVLTDEDNKNTYCLNCANKTEKEVRSLASDMESRKSFKWPIKSRMLQKLKARRRTESYNEVQKVSKGEMVSQKTMLTIWPRQRRLRLTRPQQKNSATNAWLHKARNLRCNVTRTPSR